MCKGGRSRRISNANDGEEGVVIYIIAIFLWKSLLFLELMNRFLSELIMTDVPVAIDSLVENLIDFYTRKLNLTFRLRTFHRFLISEERNSVAVCSFGMSSFVVSSIVFPVFSLGT